MMQKRWQHERTGANIKKTVLHCARRHDRGCNMLFHTDLSHRVCGGRVERVHAVSRLCAFSRISGAPNPDGHFIQEVAKSAGVRMTLINLKRAVGTQKNRITTDKDEKKII